MEVVSQKELIRYLKDSKKLKRLLDQAGKKQVSACRKKGDRAKSAPLSEELETLIRKVADGSLKKAHYRPKPLGKRNKHQQLKSTDPINQITAKSMLGRAFKRMGKECQLNSSGDDSSSMEGEDDSPGSSSEDNYS
ncbi:hypothetical protein C0992_002720, partial [Termitomyces sp. T32_za158]